MIRVKGHRLSATIALAAALAPALRPTPAGAQQHFPADAELASMVRYLVEDGEAHGVVLGVVESDGTTRVVQFGSGGPGARPLGPESVFEIGSVTKTFTATLLAEMAGRGEVALDDPVTDYLPEDVRAPTFEGRAITLIDLATHTSGISDTLDVPAVLASGDLRDLPAYTVEVMYDWLSGLELRRAPGETWEYSNLGMGLLGHALARASGQPLEALMRERILEPLGMTSTGYSLGADAEGWLVHGYRGAEEAPWAEPTPAAQGAGTLLSSMRDMLAYLAASVGPAETDLERAMRTAQAPIRSMGERGQIGLAWQTIRVNGRPLVVHGGTTIAFQSFIALDPAGRDGVVVLTNSASFGNNIATDLLVHAPIPVRDTVTPSPDVLESRTGTYRIGPYLIHVRAEPEGYLTVQSPSDVRMRLHATSDTTFFATREEWVLTFPQGARADSVYLDVRGRRQRGARLTDDTPEPAVVAGNVGVPLGPEEIARYEGVYDIDLGAQTAELQVRGTPEGRLMATLAGSVSRLVPDGERSFRVVINPDFRLVFGAGEGRAETVTVELPGRSDRGVRRRPQESSR